MERVHGAIEAWADKMRDRGVEKLYDTAARYHLALMVRDLLADERRRERATPSAVEAIRARGERIAVLAAEVKRLRAIEEAAQALVRGDAEGGPVRAEWQAMRVALAASPSSCQGPTDEAKENG